MNQLGVVESERLDGLARIEAGEKRVEELKSLIERERKATEDEIAKRIASFHKFEKVYWLKEEPLHSQLGYLG